MTTTTTTAPAGPTWQSVLSHPWIKIVALALFGPVLYITQIDDTTRSAISSSAVPFLVLFVTFPLFATAFLALIGRAAYIRASLGIFGAAYLLVGAAWFYPNPVPVEGAVLSLGSFLPSVALGLAALALIIATAFKIQPDKEDTGARYLYLVLVVTMIIVPVAGAFSHLHSITLFDKLTRADSIKTPAGPEREEQVRKIAVAEFATVIAVSVDTITSEIGTVYLVVTLLMLAVFLWELSQNPAMLTGSGPFPNTSDLSAILMSVTGIITFYTVYGVFKQLKNSLHNVAGTIVQNGGAYDPTSYFRGVVGGLQAVPFLVLAVGLGILVYRIYKAEQVRFTYCTFLLLLLAATYALCFPVARLLHNLPIGIVLLAFALGLLLSRKRWVDGTLSDPVKLASNSTLGGGVLLTFLWSPLIVISLVLASSSVAQILFLQEWGKHLTKGELVPLEFWQMIYTSFSTNTVTVYLLGALGTIICAVSVAALVTLILTLLYWIPQLLMVYIRKFLQKVTEEEPPSATPAA